MSRHGQPTGRLSGAGLPAVLLALLALAGCAAPPAGRQDFLAFLREGVTTRSDVAARIGQSPRVFGGDRIWTFRLGEDRHGLYPAPAREGWRGVRYSLVLEFDEGGVLRRHALVDVTKGA